MSFIDKPDYIFFWGIQDKNRVQKGCFSNWWPCEFVDSDNIKYYSSEQYYMAKKALTFNDQEAYEKIMATKSPRKAKEIGRTVKNYDPNVWDSCKKQVMLDAVYFKFTQNAELQEFLMNTGSRILVEASPLDKIWGIGLDEHDAEQTDSANWPGQNLLGNVLMEVRNYLTK